MGVFNINNMVVQSYVGFAPDVEINRQEFIINLSIAYNTVLEEQSDDPEDAFNIEGLTLEIIGRAENSHFNLLEAFARMVLNTILEFDRIESAEVEVKKVKQFKYSGQLSFKLNGSNI